jgi:long-subunit fatty acid transport protein
MRRALRVSAAAVLAAAALAPRVARATSVEEFPDNGSEQEGRGGAWVARASDPLATFYNPAGLAGQPTRLTLQANLSSQKTCFARVQSANDLTSDGYSPALPGGSPYPKVCSSGAFFPNPQLAFTYRVNDRIGLGIAVLGPSAVGAATWPQFVDGNPSPQRYMLISTTSVVLTPTIGIGWEAIDRLRLGASFIFGTAPSIDFVNAAPGQNEGSSTALANAANNDIHNELKAKELFFPGFILGAIWSPTDNLDVAAWYKWTSSINAKGDLTTAANDFTPAAASGHTSQVAYGDTAEPYCFTLAAGQAPPAGTPPCGSGNNAKVKVPIPMEAKLGVRYHKPRSDIPYDEHRRDPMAQDVFDVEADFTWANNSAFNAIQIRFPTGLPAAVMGSVIPSNADVTHDFRDVVGVRLGGDYNILPDQLALRAGAFFETQAANSVYQNIDFDGADRFGIAAGGTYRIRLGSEKQHALDLMAGYGHVFFGTLSNNNPNAQGLPALTGTACLNNGNPNVTTCPGGVQPYRTPWPVNLGTITSSINVINVGASYKF